MKRIHLLALSLWMLGAAAPAKATGAAIQFAGAVSQVLATGSFGGTWGLALDLSGNLYVSNADPLMPNEAPITKVAPDGTASPFPISGLPASAPSLNSPRQMAVDSAGNLYIADLANNRIVKSDSSGNGSVITCSNAGSGPCSSSGSIILNHPGGVAVDNSGNIFIADTNFGSSPSCTSACGRIVEVRPTGTASVLSTKSGTVIDSGSLNFPNGLAVDTQGNLYIADGNNSRVIEVTAAPALVGSVVPVNSALSRPVSVTVSNNGIIYILDTMQNRIAVSDPQGDTYDLFNDAENSLLEDPHAIATDSQGVFYASDVGHGVQRFDQGSVGFGHVQVASSGTPRTLNFVVNRPSPISGIAVYTAGAPNGDFQIAQSAGTCSNTITNTSCTVNVQFSPTAAGLRRGALVISYASGTSSLTVPPGSAMPRWRLYRREQRVRRASVTR